MSERLLRDQLALARASIECLVKERDRLREALGDITVVLDAHGRFYECKLCKKSAAISSNVQHADDCLLKTTEAAEAAGEKP